MAANWLSPHSFSAYILAYNSTVSVVYSFLGRMAVVLMLQVGGGGRTSSRKHIKKLHSILMYVGSSQIYRD